MTLNLKAVSRSYSISVAWVSFLCRFTDPILQFTWCLQWLLFIYSLRGVCNDYSAFISTFNSQFFLPNLNHKIHERTQILEVSSNFMHICWLLRKEKCPNNTERIRAICRPCHTANFNNLPPFHRELKGSTSGQGIHFGFMMGITRSSKLVVLSVSRRVIECPYQSHSYQWLILIHCRHKVVT